VVPTEEVRASPSSAVKLAMTLMIRDAADIIEANLRYHRAQGADLFVVAVNGSTDGTLEILEPHVEAGLVRLELMPGSLPEVWGQGRTRLARLAFELGADWVIHNDDDEFWWPLTGDLKQALEAVPERFGMVVAPRTEFPARPGEGFFADRMTIREARFLRPPKAAHRTHPEVVLGQTHPSQIWLENAAADAFSGRPGLRESGAGHSAKPSLELVLAPTFPIRVLHFPLRSFAQYCHRVEIANASAQLGADHRRNVRTAYERGRLDQLYEELVVSDDEVTKGIAEGWFLEDTDFRDYLAACPDLLAEGRPPVGSGGWSEERRERELAELQFDGMYALTRYIRGTKAGKILIASRRARYRALRKAEERVTNIEHSLWWRLRPRFPRHGASHGSSRDDGGGTGKWPANSSTLT
jgi:glycosyl transferase family 2